MHQLDICNLLSLTFYIIFIFIIYFFQLFREGKKKVEKEKIEVPLVEIVKTQESKIKSKIDCMFCIFKDFLIELKIKKHKFFVKYFYIFLYKNQDRIRIIYEILIYLWLITLILSLLYLLIFNYRIKDNICVFYLLLLLTILKNVLKNSLSQLDWCFINDYKYFDTVLLVLPFYNRRIVTFAPYPSFEDEDLSYKTKKSKWFWAEDKKEKMKQENLQKRREFNSWAYETKLKQDLSNDGRLYYLEYKKFMAQHYFQKESLAIQRKTASVARTGLIFAISCGIGSGSMIVLTQFSK
jgi:hypothetical protein